MSTCYLVLGTPRSGTSLVAGLLHRAGIPMGEKIDDPENPDRWDFGGANEWNPQGFFEDAELSNALTTAVGPMRYPFTVVRGDRTRLRAAIRARDSRGFDWGAKSARLAWVLDEFIDQCQAVKLIVTSREADRCAASWSARSKRPMSDSRQIIEAVARGLDAAADDPRVRACERITIEFDSLFDRTQQAISTLAAFIERPIDSAFIRQELRRH